MYIFTFYEFEIHIHPNYNETLHPIAPGLAGGWCTLVINGHYAGAAEASEFLIVKAKIDQFWNLGLWGVLWYK